MKYRIEHDTLGEVKVPEERLWGAQTERSLENFKIGNDRMPLEIIYALVNIKKAAAKANGLADDKADAVTAACDKILAGGYEDEFPLSVYQTGSGTQTNMNCNEVIANLADIKLHPNDDVNRAQSTNDTFPSAIQIASVIMIEDELFPALGRMIDSAGKLAEKYENIVKVGRTHLQDAVPLTYGQEFSSWKSALEKAYLRIESDVAELKEIPIGGTAVGTGLNTPEDYDIRVTKVLSNNLNKEFKPVDDKFRGLAFKDSISHTHGSLKTLAEVLMKIANDVRWYASGPRCGMGEINIPANEPGSSIMPGKVNPTQCEALSMVAAKVMGNDVTVGIAASQGNFQLNVYMPVIAATVIESIRILADSIDSFTGNCLDGITINEDKVKENLDKSLMNITALNKVIGYEKSAEIAKLAYSKGINLVDACVELGYLTEEEFKKYVDPEKMV